MDVRLGSGHTFLWQRGRISRKFIFRHPIDGIFVPVFISGDVSGTPVVRGQGPLWFLRRKRVPMKDVELMMLRIPLLLLVWLTNQFCALDVHLQ